MDIPQEPLERLPILPERSGRLLFIDGLRGVAAAAVMLFHFYSPLVSPAHEALARVVPGWLGKILSHGDLGVEIFFVISGFVIAYTIRNAVVGARYAVIFMIRRSLRLDPPYWIVLFVVVAWRMILWRKFAGLYFREFGGFRGIVLNMFYLPDLLASWNNYRHPIIGVAWTLCLEIQFYLVFITLVAMAQFAGRKWNSQAQGWATLLLFGPLTLYSIRFWTAHVQFDFRGMWFMFFLGAVLAWALTGKVAQTWLWLFVAATIAFARPDRYVLSALATVIAIYVCARRGRMQTWLKWPWIQFLGKISYSLYLTHIYVGIAVITVVMAYSDKSFVSAVTACILAVFVSIAVSSGLQRWVEQPFIRLGKQLKPRRETTPEAAASQQLEPIAVVERV